MNKQLNDILTGNGSNYLLPFFWMKDLGPDKLRQRVAEVADSGCRAFCVESRTHDDFVGEHWWRDMDILLDEAEKRGMQVWVLDDKHFPTGYANGLVPKKYPERRKWQLIEHHIDVYGPMKGATLMFWDRYADDELLAVYAYKRTESGEGITSEWIDLTENAKHDRLRFDVPEGIWRVFFFYKTRKGTNQTEYIHLIDEESVSTLIEAVYEPHYEHYARYFGKTLMGFFSDEPSLGNTYCYGDGTSADIYSRTLGLPNLALPWTDALYADMKEALGDDATPLLAALWHPMEGKEHLARYTYMDILTRHWRKAFSQQLGNWCKDHGVEYIGHIIEDCNAHARLDTSAGHYFRALDGQHMAGIDVVLHQILPGFSDCTHAYSCPGVSDPEFFEYMLAKLAASHSHIQPTMKGRAMCEIFGAYGWAEGAPMMKYLMDHMLLRGINHFVPHAFTSIFPDPDCPPHFGVSGMDPQFAGFTKLMNYANKVSHLLCGAEHKADVAILYHAEAEWCGGRYMFTHKPAKALYDNQIDYDILPFDALANARGENARLALENETYGALIVPGASYLPEEGLKQLERLSTEGVPVWFVDERPENANVFGRVIPFENLVGSASAFASVRLEKPYPALHFYRAEREDMHVYMIMNESAVNTFDGEIVLPDSGEALKLDLLLDRMHRISAENGKVHLTLAPEQSTILVFGDDLPDAPQEKAENSRTALDCEWDISLLAAGDKDGYKPLCATKELFDIMEDESRFDFSGWMRYTARFQLENIDAVSLALGEVGQTAQVRLNGKELGIRIAEPYIFDIKGLLTKGENEIEIIVANTLAGMVPHELSTFFQIPRSGLIGPVELVY